MDFKIKITSISVFDDTLTAICEANNFEPPNHVEIDSDDSAFIKVFVSDGFIARLSKEDINKLKDIK